MHYDKIKLKHIDKGHYITRCGRFEVRRLNQEHYKSTRTWEIFDKTTDARLEKTGRDLEEVRMRISEFLYQEGQP